MYVRPGFFPGGQNDPAMGGGGYYTPRPAPGNQFPEAYPGIGGGGMPQPGYPGMGGFGGFGGFGGMGVMGGYPGMPQFQPPGGGMNPYLGQVMGYGGGFNYPQPSFPGGMTQPGFPSGAPSWMPSGAPSHRPGPGLIGGTGGGMPGQIAEGTFNPGPNVQNPGMPNHGLAPKNPPPGPAPFKPNVSAGRLAEAQRLAAAGKMGRAKQQWEKGGGTWSTQAHKFLKNG